MFTLEAQRFGFVSLKNKFSVFKIKVFKAQNKAKKKQKQYRKTYLGMIFS